MKHPKKEIAELFSNGKFEGLLDYFNEGIVWNIIGENIFSGKSAVVKNCEQTAAYFKSVQTEFITHDILVSGNQVAITGTAEFKQDGKRINFINACDVYTFNDKDEIIKIASYCIPDKK